MEIEIYLEKKRDAYLTLANSKQLELVQSVAAPLELDSLLNKVCQDNNN